MSKLPEIMSENFNRCIPHILFSEGGFVNDPQDPGGPTNLGISLRFLKGTGDISFDLDHDGDIDVDDIRKMKTSDAGRAYKKYFWDPLRLDELKNASLCLQVFDHSINAGARSAVKILQLVSGCKPDGIMGPKTIAAANTFNDGIAQRYCDQRIAFYEILAQKNAKFKKYLHGWINRCIRTKNAI
jgi:lysozyme family protein